MALKVVAAACLLLTERPLTGGTERAEDGAATAVGEVFAEMEVAVGAAAAVHVAVAEEELAGGEREEGEGAAEPVTVERDCATTCE